MRVVAFTTDLSDFGLHRVTAPPAARSADTRKADIDAPIRNQSRFLAIDPLQAFEPADSDNKLTGNRTLVDRWLLPRL
jgi:hypothetical protein